MRAIAYCRVSSADQVDGTSLDVQRQQVQAYATLKGIELVGTFVDSAVSGGKPIASRPEGAKLVSLVESGEVQAVIIVKLDRAFRNVVDCLQTIDSWEQRGVSLHIVDHGGNSVDCTSPTGRFVLTTLAACAEMERGQIRARCEAGRTARKAQGQRIGQVPYGMSLAADGKTLVEDSAEQEALHLMHSMQASGHTLRAIAAELNARGVRNTKGRQWTHGAVASILKRAA